MKIFIYSESEQAGTLRDAERAAGNTAFLRNPKCFDPADFDSSCDRAVTDDAKIAEAFKKLGKEVVALSAPRTEPKKTDEPVKTAEPVKRKPRKR